MTNDIKNRTEKFLNILFNKPEINGSLIHFLKQVGGGMKEDSVAAIPDFTNFYYYQGQDNKFFTPNVFENDTTHRRIKRKVSYLNAFYIDLDLKDVVGEETIINLEKKYLQNVNHIDPIKYKTSETLYLRDYRVGEYTLDIQSILKYCKDMGIPLPSIVVWSGRGYHLYWSFTKAVAKTTTSIGQYKFIADSMKGYFEKFGMDEGVSGDIVRILRVPYTYNTKQGIRRFVEIVYLGERIGFEDLYKWAKNNISKSKSSPLLSLVNGKKEKVVSSYHRIEDPNKRDSFRTSLLNIGGKYWKKDYRHNLMFSMAAILYYVGFPTAEIEQILAPKIEEWNGMNRETEEFKRILKSQLKEMPEHESLGEFSIFPVKKLPDGYKDEVKKLLTQYGVFRKFIRLDNEVKFDEEKNEEIGKIYRPYIRILVASNKNVSLIKRKYSKTLTSPVPLSLEELKNEEYTNELMAEILAFKPSNFRKDTPAVYKSVLLPDGIVTSSNEVLLNIDSMVYWERPKLSTNIRDLSLESPMDLYNYIQCKLHEKVFKNELGKVAEVAKEIYDYLVDIAIPGPPRMRVLALNEYEGKIVLTKPHTLPEGLDKDYSKEDALKTYNRIVSALQTITDEDRSRIAKALSYLIKPHDIVIAGHAIASMLRWIIRPSVSPHLFVIGKARVGKTSVSNAFALVKGKEAKTAHQYLQSIHGYGCGTIVLDELGVIPPNLMEILKDIGTNLLFNQEYGRQSKRRVGAVSAVITSNDIPTIGWENKDDMEGLLRRFIAIFPEDEDQDNSEEVNSAVKLLRDERYMFKLMGFIVNYLMKLDPNSIRNFYKSYVREYDEIIGFIYLGIDLYKKFLEEELNVKLPPNIFEKAKERVKKDTSKIYNMLVGSGTVSVADTFRKVILDILTEKLAKKVKARYDNQQDVLSFVSSYAKVLWDLAGIAVVLKDDDTIRVFFNANGAKTIAEKMIAEGINVVGKTGKALISFLKEYLNDASGEFVITKVLDFNTTILYPGGDHIWASVIDLKRHISIPSKSESYNNLIEGEQVVRFPYKDILKEVIENYLYSDFSYENLLNYLISRGFSKDHIDAFISEGLKNGDLIEIKEKRYRLSNPDGILNGSE